MRYFFLFAAVLLLAGCSDNNIEFTGTLAGASTGKVMIKNAANEIVYEADIVDGKFHINKQPLTQPGFYKLSYLLSGTSSKKHEIYLERGSAYTIAVDKNSLDVYPDIKSTSKKQTELSGYYDLLRAAKADSRTKVMALDSQMQNLGEQALTAADHSTRLQELRNQQLDANVVDMAALFKTFIKKYPDSELTPYLMLNTEYQLDPAGYYQAFKMLNDDAKETPEGETLEEKLKQLTRLAAGGEAPPIEGTTPDGKTIDIKSLNKKVILLDFWRALNSQSLGDHTDMANKLLPKYSAKGLGIVSVSFDSDRDKWIAYAAKSNITWPHVSDLKGDDSPNVQNWAITKIPTYYLLDGTGHIIKRCLDYYEVQTALADYFTKHP